MVPIQRFSPTDFLRHAVARRKKSYSLERMYIRILFTALITTIALPAFGQVICGQTPCASSSPQFESFPALASLNQQPAQVDLKSHPKANHFRTALRSGARNGPNFSGAYTIVTWGCGVACKELAIVSSGNGKVFFPTTIRLNAYHVVHEDPLPNPFQFRLDSSLLVVVGAPNDGKESGIFFYRWNGHNLELVYKEARTWR